MRIMEAVTRGCIPVIVQVWILNPSHFRRISMHLVAPGMRDRA